MPEIKIDEVDLDMIHAALDGDGNWIFWSRVVPNDAVLYAYPAGSNRGFIAPESGMKPVRRDDGWYWVCSDNAPTSLAH